MAKRGAAIAAGTVGVVVLVLAACADEAPPEHGPGSERTEHGVHVGAAEYQPTTLADAGATEDVVAAADGLGLAMVRSAEPGENLVSSPASAIFALTMLTEGARGSTLTQLEELLGAEGPERTEAMSALQASLSAYDDDPALAVGEELPDVPLAHVANNLVLDDESIVNEEYLDSLLAAYDAGVQVTDLSASEGKEVLDAWVREHTAGLIEESAIEPHPDLYLVLQNSVLFAAEWQRPFDERSTSDREFTLSEGSVVDVPMMAQTLPAAYAETAEWQAIRLPYTEGFHADVMLPAPGADPHTIELGTMQRLSDDLGGVESTPIELRLPTVDTTTRLDLVPVLEAAGVVDVFDEEAADLSGIADTELAVSEVNQQAVLQIDEEGTVAAAVTEIEVEASSAEVENLTMFVDRPFLFRVTHAETGLTLFLATIGDPSQ